MVVQHNLTAMNSNRMLGITTKTQAKATEKLSSGYKINRAADDAAGLAISEKMRKQIRGLTQASANAQDGISAVQTAEGALTEVHDMLQRMNELAVKAANGTMSESDRNAIQNEVDQLVTEIDRVATTTKFNETYLLKGSNGGVAGSLKYTTANTNLGSTVTGDINFNATTGTGSVAVTKRQGAVITGTTTKADTQQFEVGNTTYVLVESTALSGTTGDKLSVKEAAEKITNSTGGVLAGVTGGTKGFTSMDALMAAIKRDHSEDIKNVSSYVDANNGNKVTLKVEAFANLNDAIDFSLHVGADSSDDNKINLNISSMGARGLGINGLTITGDNDDNATGAIDVVADALERVSAQRATLGAVQNRLEHTIANLDNVVENTTSAESAIRDTDMATQMVTYSNNQILAQAGQAMLAQSNQANQGVLSLLG
ncbi:flagellin N-terminal helical domain-containing protein [Acetatifactor aquisgranensis]|uniref:flagellin N-terminal helical domain-containing protein n=1 Tax=Acetatifactor aquisgranensis TaxID=2941233 RepID=UPI00203B6E7D|nr:flagellin [Acetatifactor aquisgranensis]